MNKNSKARQKFIAATAKVNGGFKTPAYKKKVQPFPRPDKDADLSMMVQSRMFNENIGIEQARQNKS